MNVVTERSIPGFKWMGVGRIGFEYQLREWEVCVAMQLEVLLFAAARDAAGSDKICVDVSEPVLARDVIEAVGRKLPQLEGLLPSCRLAIDCAYVDPETPVRDSHNELALIPPVSGG